MNIKVSSVRDTQYRRPTGEGGAMSATIVAHVELASRFKGEHAERLEVYVNVFLIEWFALIPALKID